ILASVKAAERRLLEAEKTKNYRPIDGDPDYGRRVRELLFGADDERVSSGRAVTAHTPGGTGALRVVGDLLRDLRPETNVWMSDPTWANHGQVFRAAGLSTKTYPYFDKASNGIAFEALLGALEQVPAGDAVLLHACCHNPSGADPSAEQWEAIARVLSKRGAFPLVDFAYQGFGSGLSADALGLRKLLEHCGEAAICSSFSKNFGLYNERTGALTLVAQSPAHAASVQSRLKVAIRSNYSNPPAHGGAIVSTILGDAELRQQWEGEVQAMRDRIAGMRRLFVQTLAQKGIAQDFSFIERQKGMFSFSGLSPDQVQRLREEHAIYIVGSGRINVAGMNEQNVGVICEAIKAVL